MSFDKIFDFTSGVYFNFYNIFVALCISSTDTSRHYRARVARTDDLRKIQGVRQLNAA